jgi:hypothetical protein
MIRAEVFSCRHSCPEVLSSHLLQVSFSSCFGMMPRESTCSAKAHRVTESKTKDRPRQTLSDKVMCPRAYNLRAWVYWDIQKSCTGEYLAAGLELTLNLIENHSFECQLGMTRGTLNGGPRWIRFVAAQVKAVVIRRVTQQLGFRPYIGRFSQRAGCIVGPDREDPVFFKFGQSCSISCRKGGGSALLRLEVHCLPDVRRPGATSGSCMEVTWRAARGAQRLSDFQHLKKGQCLRGFTSWSTRKSQTNSTGNCPFVSAGQPIPYVRRAPASRGLAESEDEICNHNLQENRAGGGSSAPLGHHGKSSTQKVLSNISCLVHRATPRSTRLKSIM